MFQKAGVNTFVQRIKLKTDKVPKKHVLTNIGGFSGYVDIAKTYKHPVIALSTDGVGSKMKISQRLDDYTTIGIDLVAMCVNDIITSGARPIAFLDYYGCSYLDLNKGNDIISGILEGCALAECELVGGETAIMPHHYISNNFDIVGFAVGINEKENIIDGSTVQPDDVILGLPSSGIHANGYSLINQIIDENNASWQISRSFLQELLTPTKIYVSEVLTLLRHCEIHAMAHITSGGIVENLERVTNNQSFIIDKNAWQIPEIYTKLLRIGEISNKEMRSTFNCGIGYCFILDQKNAEKAKSINSELIEIGKII